jgi:isoleucyl-tRNA synthetase
VYGSLAELEADFGRLPLNDKGEPDLHRPYIDDLTRPNPDDPTGQSTMRRIPDVLDVWFDSGSMPFAQVHYPFENRDWFEHHYPGDFIVEYIGQTRGWFYLLHVLATALFDRPAFRTAVSHGIVLGSDGRKMSKSLRNYPDVSEVLNRDGSDAMRWFLMSSPILRGGNLIVTEDGIRDSVRQVLLPVWSTYYFFTLYAGAANGGEGYIARAVRADEVAGLPDMDRYLLARTHNLVASVTEQMDRYDIAGACESVREYLDALTNWYVRTQRDRFWREDHNAFNTLFTALETLTRVMAPLAPLLAEEVWRGLTGGRSVHLQDWVDLSGSFGEVLIADDTLVGTMEQVRNAVSLGLSLRKANKQRVRQPLAKLTVVVPDQQTLSPYTDILASELNVKSVELTELSEEATAAYGITQNLAVNARAAGPRLGRGVQAVIKAAKAGDWSVVDDAVVVRTADGDVALEASEYELTTVVGGGADGQIAAAVLAGGGFVVLDLALTPELLAEGYARDVIRDVQDARKGAGLDVADRINLTLTVPEEYAPAVEANRELIMSETLVLTLSVVADAVDERAVAVKKAEA